MWKTLEIIIAKRMQHMGQIENKNMIFDIFCIRWKITGGSGSRFSTRPKGGSSSKAIERKVIQWLYWQPKPLGAIASQW